MHPEAVIALDTVLLAVMAGQFRCRLSTPVKMTSGLPNKWHLHRRRRNPISSQALVHQVMHVSSAITTAAAALVEVNVSAGKLGMKNISMIQWKSFWREMASNARTMGVGGYVLVGILLILLAGVVVGAVLGWSSAAGTDVPSFGYAAMAVGIAFSLVLGIGLMALIFYSSRSGYDDPVRIIPPDSDEDSGR